MCGRTVFTLSRKRVCRVANVGMDPSTEREFHTLHSFNLCPTNGLICVVQGEDGARELTRMKWGLEPRFSTSHHLSTINARSESIEHSRLYSGLVDSSRCVVIVDAFYEWDQRPKEHTPYIIRYVDSVKEDSIPLRHGAESVFCSEDRSGDVEREYLPEGVSPLLLAAIYDTKSGEHSCSILTAESRGSVSKIHDRMPVLLTPETAKLWLETQPFEAIIGPVVKGSIAAGEKLQCMQVSSQVNSTSNKGRDVTLPLAEFRKQSLQKGLGKYFKAKQ